MITRLWFAVATAILIAARSSPAAGTGAPDPVALETWAPGSPAACPMARTEGTLVRHPESGAGLRDHEGVVWRVMWPTDYAARQDGGRLAVVDGAGVVIAREGDLVELGGAEEGDAWLACGGMRIVRQ